MTTIESDYSVHVWAGIEATRPSRPDVTVVGMTPSRRPQLQFCAAVPVPARCRGTLGRERVGCYHGPSSFEELRP